MAHLYIVFIVDFSMKNGDFLVKQFAIEAMAIEIVDLPIERLPEGILKQNLGMKIAFITISRRFIA